MWHDQDTLDFMPDVLTSADGYSARVPMMSLAISPPTNLLLPTVVVQAQSTIAFCDDLELDASKPSKMKF